VSIAPSRGRRGLPGGRVALVAVVLALVLGAVVSGTRALLSGSPRSESTTGGEFDEIAGVPLLRGAYRTDGPLADDLTVPEGTVLLGEVLPADDLFLPGPGEGTGWRAFLLVTGDVSDVVAGLANQASAIGMSQVDDDEFWNECSPPAPQPDADGVATCRILWGDDERVLQASVWRGNEKSSDDLAARPISLMQVEVADLAATESPPASPPAAAPTTVVPPATAVTPDAVPADPAVGVEPLPTVIDRAGPVVVPVVPVVHADAVADDDVDPPFPQGWTEPPGPGELLGDGFVVPPPEVDQVLSLRVPQGAHAIVAPWPTPEGHGPIYSALLSVTGDVDAVMQDFAVQIADRVDGDPSVGSRAVDGAMLRSTGGSQAGGDGYRVLAVTLDDRSWVWVHTGYD
jgi:hypothetical protein